VPRHRPRLRTTARTPRDRGPLGDDHHLDPAPARRRPGQVLPTLPDQAAALDGPLPAEESQANTPSIDHAARHGVRYIAHPGGSARAEEVQQACDEQSITLVNTGIRLFHH